jgi:hypothetical protein
VFGRVARVLAVLGLAVFPTVVLSTGPAAALCVGSSICNPANAPLLAEFATSAGPTLTTAATTAGVTVGGASASAPIAAIPLTSAATTAGASSSVWGAAVGKIVTLLGGLAAWNFIAPTSTSSLPSGAVSASAGVLFKPAAVTITSAGLPRLDGLSRWGADATRWTAIAGNYSGYNYCYPLTSPPADPATQTAGATGGYNGYQSFDYTSSAGGGPTVWSGQTVQGPGFSISTAGGCVAGSFPFLTRLDFSQGRVWIRNTPPSGSTSPLRHIEQTVTCKTAAGVVTTSTYVGTSAVWAGSQLVDVAGLMCPSGSRAVGVSATVKTDGGADFVVADVPYVAGNSLDSATDTIPEACYTGSTACTLDLERATSPAQTTWVKVNPDDYPDWWTDPSRDVLYRCRYGTAETWITVPIASCSVYRDGSTVADPVPTTDSPTTDSSADCNFGWSDLLTGGIFVRGGKCILTWAFVPSDGFMNAKVDEIRTSWDGTAPVVVFQTANSVWGPWYQARTVPSGCEGPSLTITNMVSDAHPFTACGEIAQAVVPIGKPLIAGVVLVGAVLGAARTLGRSFGIDASSRGEPM